MPRPFAPTLVSVALAFLFVLTPVRAAENDLQKFTRLHIEALANGKYAQAIEYAKRWRDTALPRANKAYPAYAVRAVADDFMARAYLQMGDLKKSEELSLSALSGIERWKGPNDPMVAEMLTNLGNTYNAKGAYKEALKVQLRVLALMEKFHGSRADRDWMISGALSNLGNVYVNLAQDKEAEDAFKRGLAIQDQVPTVNKGKYDPSTSLVANESVRGRNDRRTAALMSNLAVLYIGQDRLDEALALLDRSLRIDEDIKGRDNPELATPLMNIGNIYYYRREFERSEMAYRRVIQVAGSNSGLVASSLLNIANIDFDRDKIDSARRGYLRALDMIESAYGRTSTKLCSPLIRLGAAALKEKKYGEAEKFAARCLEISASAGHPNLGELMDCYDVLAGAYEQRGDTADAVKASRKVLDLFRGLSQTSTIRTNRLRPLVVHHLRHLEASYKAADSVETARLIAYEAFETAQILNRSVAAKALQQMGERVAQGSSELAGLVRIEQDLQRSGDAAGKALVGALSKPEAERQPKQIAEQKQALTTIENELAELRKRISLQYPAYSDLNSNEMKAAEVQRVLTDDEALVLWTLGEDESFIFALTKTNLVWNKIPIGLVAFTEKVAAFRKGLTIESLDEAGKGGANQLFDLNLAHGLYKDLFGSVEGAVKDKSRWMLVQPDVLTALPMHLLLTSAPIDLPKFADDLSPYKTAPWLLRRHATSVLPSVSGLRALRNLVARTSASKTMVGFGDPIFGPETAKFAQRSPRAVVAPAYSEFWKGADIDRSMLAAALPRLADTADELNDIANLLSVPKTDIHLRAEANEGLLKRIPLSDYKIVYFATHGLVAGDVKGLAEPSLVLSMPKEPSESDDGLLTASEVAQLKLNADWVVLSACNTIAGDKPGAEALSGLARAFFYAGARALLVSHWPVDSAATTALTTATFNILKERPELGRAEGLRRAMLAYLEKPDAPAKIYPAFWGAFVVVGEGSAE